MVLRLGCIFLCLLLFDISAVARSEQPWTEVRSPHFRVLTNGDAGDARRVAQGFEQMRYVFVTQFPTFRVDSGAPLTIFAVRDQRTEKLLEPGIWKQKGEVKPDGLFKHRWDKQYALVRLDINEVWAPIVAYHEYTHSILALNSHWLPIWLNEGMAEFYGYTRFEGHKIILGAPTIRTAALMGTPVPIRELIGEKNPLSDGGDPKKTEMFYAESWALVHYMMFGEGMEGGRKLDRFFAMMQDGTDQSKAFEQIFGSPEAMDKRFDQYMRNLAFHAAVLPNPPEIKDKEFVTRKLSIAETDAELAGYHMANRDVTDAGPLVAAALKDDPKLGLAHENEGFLLFEQGKDAEALAEFSQAYTLDPKLYLSLFAKTMMSPLAQSNTAADEAALHDALLEVADLNPQFAPAYVQMARLAVRQGDLKRALGLSRRAEELEPSRAGYHLLTGQILLRMGKDVEAAGDAEYVARLWFGPDHDEAVELWNSVPAKQRPTGATLAYEAPNGTKTVTGVVESVNCGTAAGNTVVLRDGGKLLTFRLTDRHMAGMPDTYWYGSDHFALCHHLTGEPALLRYRPDAGTAVGGEMVEIEMRDPLPTAASDKKADTQLAAKP